MYFISFCFFFRLHRYSRVLYVMSIQSCTWSDLMACLFYCYCVPFRHWEREREQWLRDTHTHTIMVVGMNTYIYIFWCYNCIYLKRTYANCLLIESFSGERLLLSFKSPAYRTVIVYFSLFFCSLATATANFHFCHSVCLIFIRFWPFILDI